jgi:hypothetical protein
MSENNQPIKRLTRAKAIRAKCLDCCCGQAVEVRLCTVQKCPLFPYRMGKEDKDVYLPSETEFTEKTPKNSMIFDSETDCEVFNLD